MRRLGVMISAGLALSIFILAAAGCDEEKKEVCCKCTCFINDDPTRDRIEYVNGTNLNCTSACRTECVDIRGMQYRDPISVDCATVPTDE